MPRDGEPRVTIRLAPESLAAIEGAARSANVSTGALIRECAERYAVTVAREVARGDLKLRRATAAVEAAGGAVVPASSLLRSDTAEAVARERQRRINEQTARARAAAAKGRR